MKNRNVKRINELKGILLKRRYDLVEKVDRSMQEGAATLTSDENDAATYAESEDLALNIANMDSTTLREVDLALQRIDSGDYGVCDNCEGDIGTARLKAIPHATLCIECKALEEQGLI